MIKDSNKNDILSIQFLKNHMIEWQDIDSPEKAKKINEIKKLLEIENERLNGK